MSSPRSSAADLRRRVPSVDEVLGDPALRAIEERHERRQALAGHVREALEAARLRGGSPPGIARVADGRVVLDLRTVAPEAEETLREAISRAMA